ncbi:MAG: glycosyltransferase family 4 protein [Gammaproteobacteria bacterium]|nr:glycosyltransferase family 4 protein [Gammaproteobacteria bacterium]MYF29718.1 glycosyltransferase family 4 protein [Gammaproteobacteria bacterium]MYK45025.1 glycosyltransferase family 4 protein [Gammaproteobacteria bacterium]
MGFVPTRILLVSPLPPPTGGMQTWTETLLRRGLPEPFAVDLVNTRQTVKRRRPGRPRLSYGEAARFFRILRRFRAVLRTSRPALAHLNSSFTPTATLLNLGTTWIARRAGVPYVVHLHGTFREPDGTGLASRLYRRAYRHIFDGAAWILLLSKGSERAVLAIGDYGHKTTGSMPNFIDFHAVPPRSRIASRVDHPMKVVFTGTIWPPKGIATIASVAERVPDAVFQLVGGGPSELRDAFIRDLESRQLLGRVSVLDARPNKEVFALLAEADVFFFPSLREGLPNSVLEAMAVGLPVVASNVGAIPEIIDVPDGGMLLDPEDVDGFARAIDHLRTRPELRDEMGRYNRMKAERNYEYDVVVKRLCSIYDDILCREQIT